MTVTSSLLQRPGAAALLVVLTAGCRGAPGDQEPGGETEADRSSGKEVLVAAEEGLPFSPAVRARGDIVFLSGEIGREPGSFEVVEGGIQPETRQTLENIRATLEQAGGSMENVVKCTAFLDDMSEWGAMNEVYREFFPEDPPARSALGADGLAAGAGVEIECIAVLP